MGVTERQFLELSRYETSDAFDDLERAVLDLAVAMARTPTDVPPELTERLRRHLDEAQLVELAAAIAWEHFRARFNRVFGVRSSRFSEGAYCVVPERQAAGKFLFGPRFANLPALSGGTSVARMPCSRGVARSDDERGVVCARARRRIGF